MCCPFIFCFKDGVAAVAMDGLVVFPEQMLPSGFIIRSENGWNGEPTSLC
jgi:hypothetical protein